MFKMIKYVIGSVVYVFYMHLYSTVHVWAMLADWLSRYPRGHLMSGRRFEYRRSNLIVANPQDLVLGFTGIAYPKTVTSPLRNLSILHMTQMRFLHGF